MSQENSRPDVSIMTLHLCGEAQKLLSKTQKVVDCITAIYKP